MLIRSVVLALLLACAGAHSASAQVTAPVIVGSYYEQNGRNLCTAESSTSGGGSSGIAGSRFCRVDFAIPPTGKLLSISHVSCMIVTTDGPMTDLYMTIVRSGTDGRIQRFQPLLLTQSGASYTYLLAQDTEYLVASAPTIVMKNVDYSSISLDCQIIGALVNKP